MYRAPGDGANCLKAVSRRYKRFVDALAPANGFDVTFIMLKSSCGLLRPRVGTGRQLGWRTDRMVVALASAAC